MTGSEHCTSFRNVHPHSHQVIFSPRVPGHQSNPNAFLGLHACALCKPASPLSIRLSSSYQEHHNDSFYNCISILSLPLTISTSSSQSQLNQGGGTTGVCLKDPQSRTHGEAAAGAQAGTQDDQPLHQRLGQQQQPGAATEAAEACTYTEGG